MRIETLSAVVIAYLKLFSLTERMVVLLCIIVITAYILLLHIRSCERWQSLVGMWHSMPNKQLDTFIDTPEFPISFCTIEYGIQIDWNLINGKFKFVVCRIGSRHSFESMVPNPRANHIRHQIEYKIYKKKKNVHTFLSFHTFSIATNRLVSIIPMYICMHEMVRCVQTTNMHFTDVKRFVIRCEYAVCVVKWYTGASKQLYIYGEYAPRFSLLLLLLL